MTTTTMTYNTIRYHPQLKYPQLMRKETGDFSENKSFYSYVGDHLMPSASAKSAIPSGNAGQTRFYDSFVYFLAMFDTLAIISFKNFPSSPASAAGGEEVMGEITA